MSELSDIPKHATNRQFWRFLGEGVTNRVRNRVQQKHRNVHGQRFDAYDDDYADKKSQGDAAPFGVPQASQSTTPDMTLTGKTMADLQVRRVSDSNVQIGWMGLHGGIIEDLSKRKNYQVVNTGAGDPFATDEMRWIEKEVNKRYDKAIAKYTKTTKTIRIGK